MVTFGWSFLILPLPALSPVVVGVRPPISRMVSPSFFLVHRWLPITSSHLFPSGLSKLSASRGNGFLFGKDAAFAIPVSLLSYSNRSSFQRSLDGRRMRAPFTCFYDAKEKPEPNSPQEGSALDWPILERWDVPWQWQTIMLTMFACALSIALTELVEASVLPYLGLQIGELSLDEKAEVLFAGQFTVTAAVLGVIYGITNSFQPLPDDIFRYDLKEPFNLRNGWLLWAGIGFSGAVIAIALTGVALSFFTGGNPERETDALVRLLPLIGSSNIRTACLIGITGVLAPLLEETVFRGFLMVSLTKWLPTPVCVLITAALFALAHLTPAEFPQLFILGTALGLSYAQTRNLLTPITIHSFWNSGVILLLTFLQVQGYDIRELLQASS